MPTELYGGSPTNSDVFRYPVKVCDVTDNVHIDLISYSAVAETRAVSFDDAAARNDKLSDNRMPVALLARLRAPRWRISMTLEANECSPLHAIWSTLGL